MGALRGNRPAVDISSMTKAELIAYGEANGVVGLSMQMLKADIITAIQEALH